ncbi:helix-turn-helix transcriptional regulator [Dongia sp.]|uniref:helix-turn-helix transcriptional regulator n=1 Tax=Dongia sp. TaxID=1977262 RepID=UPI0035B23B27
MERSSRLFEIIQLLRSATAPMTARDIATTLEVTTRTIYRDMAVLQARRVPIEGEAGIGYVMRAGFDLPPLMFSPEEMEAIAIGLSLLGRTGDHALQLAARRVAQKIACVRPETKREATGEAHLLASGWHAIPAAPVDPGAIRAAIRAAQCLALHYTDAQGVPSERKVRPVALVYYVDSIVLGAWCDLRAAFRHFRLDRIRSCAVLGESFVATAAALRIAWHQHIKAP